MNEINEISLIHPDIWLYNQIGAEGLVLLYCPHRGIIWWRGCTAQCGAGDDQVEMSKFHVD